MIDPGSSQVRRRGDQLGREYGSLLHLGHTELAKPGGHRLASRPGDQASGSWARRRWTSRRRVHQGRSSATAIGSPPVCRLPDGAAGAVATVPPGGRPRAAGVARSSWPSRRARRSTGDALRRQRDGARIPTPRSAYGRARDASRSGSSGIATSHRCHDFLHSLGLHLCQAPQLALPQTGALCRRGRRPQPGQTILGGKPGRRHMRQAIREGASPGDMARAVRAARYPVDHQAAASEPRANPAPFAHSCSILALAGNCTARCCPIHRCHLSSSSPASSCQLRSRGSLRPPAPRRAPDAGGRPGAARPPRSGR